MIKSVIADVVENEIVYGIDNCEGTDWRFLKDEIGCINELGETIKFKIHRATDKFIYFLTETKGKEKNYTYNGGIVANMEKVKPLPKGWLDTLVDVARAYNAMQILTYDYHGFNYLESSLEKLESEIRDIANTVAEFFESDMEIIETMKFFFEDKDEFEQILPSIWDILKEEVSIEMCEVEELEDIMEYLRNKEGV